MPIGVGYAAYCVIGGRLYVAGGTRGSGTGKSLSREVIDEIESGDMSLRMRTGSADLLAPRQGPRVLCTSGTVAFLGAPLATPLATGPGPRWSP